MKSKWRKVLYEDQGVPDNYVDESFLDEMKKNLYTRTYDFWPVVVASGAVTQQMCSVCLFFVLYLYMEENVLAPQTVCVMLVVITILGYTGNTLLYRKIQSMEYSKDGDHIIHENSRTVWSDTKTMILFVGAGYGLSPVLMTLTRTISTDTIYAMTVFMLLGNLLFHDYGAGAAMVSQSVSLNAAIFASVCLASRLGTTWHAFTTITSAVVIFALTPVFRKNLQTALPQSRIVTTVSMGLLTLVTIATVSKVAAILFLLVHIFVTFICPAWLIKIQPYKNNINGPWDEAVIKD